VIQNEIMVYHGYAKPISFKPTYIKLKWLKMKEENDYIDVMFMLMERQLPKSFFVQKVKLNPLKDPLPKMFIETLK
jgi:hypothetical protein